MTRAAPIWYLRDEQVDGVGPWWWMQGDTGLWDGPSTDWFEHWKVWQANTKQFRTCIQAGGGFGMYPRLLSRFFQNVHSFEADPDSYRGLMMNTFNLQNVKIYNIALGEEVRRAYMDTNDRGNMGTHRVHMSSTEEPNIDVTKLDLYQLENVDFIQLDVENYEINVLHGANETIKKWLPTISVECNNTAIEGFLKPYGYEICGKSHSDTTYAVK